MKYKLDADSMNELLSSFSVGLVKRMATEIINNARPIHEIGLINIYLDSKGFWKSVNRESLSIKYFDSEQDAIDYYLDKYQGTKEFKQQNLFNP